MNVAIIIRGSVAVGAHVDSVRLLDFSVKVICHKNKILSCGKNAGGRECNRLVSAVEQPVISGARLKSNPHPESSHCKGIGEPPSDPERRNFLPDFRRQYKSVSRSAILMRGVIHPQRPCSARRVRPHDDFRPVPARFCRFQPARSLP